MIMQITKELALCVNPSVKEKSSKKKGFNIVVTEEGNQKYYLKALEKELKKYPFLKQQGFFTRRNSLSSASYLDVVVFGGSNKFDYTVTNMIEEVPVNNKSFDLISEFSKIRERLAEYVEKNYPQKVNNKKFDIEINIEFTKEKPAVKSKSKYEVYRIHDTFVKIGYKTYDIYVDTLTGDEYIKLNGQKIFILEDKCGDKYLA